VLKAISSYTYQLDTPPGIYNVFHISLLCPTMDNPFLSQSNGDYQLPPRLVNSEAKYLVEEILQECKKWVGQGHYREYLIK
jgi:hypothetical protein